jgi:hypothetical protein
VGSLGTPWAVALTVGFVGNLTLRHPGLATIFAILIVATSPARPS